MLASIDFSIILWNNFRKMERDFLDAIVQEADGWPGMRMLLSEWMLYATNREARSMLRIHRSPQLRRILREFLQSDSVGTTS